MLNTWVQAGTFTDMNIYIYIYIYIYVKKNMRYIKGPLFGI